MEQIQYKIDVFEGPMDLLLHLITKHKLNIYDIPIIELVEQYTAYIRRMQEQDLDVASEFLEMAARLIHIKSLSLLPVHEEGEALKRELTGELIEYAACKQAAAALSQQTDGFNAMARPPEKIEADMTYTRLHDPIELVNAYMRVVGKKLRRMPPRSGRPPAYFRGSSRWRRDGQWTERDTGSRIRSPPPRSSVRRRWT